MKKILITLLLLSSILMNAQFPGSQKDMAKAMKDIKGRVYGKLIDATTQKPIEYAPVMVLWFNKDSLLGGALTDEKGEFSIEGLPPIGGFRFRATQIGYKTFESRFYIQMPNKLEVDLGDLKCDIDQKLLKQVDVVAEKSTVVMSIDKRTYNVDKDISLRGGTAADAMKNVPGVTVDADGNAQLRNQSPTIFVDGRPTNLTLQQIPADQIDRIEIITNPSVKFDASATGGILNIIMKKNLKPGYNGMIMTYVGTGDRYGGMANVNVKEGKWNLSAMYSYNQSLNLTQGFTRRTQLDSGDVLGYYNQGNNSRMMNKFNFGKIGIDYNLTNRQTLSCNAMLMAGRFNTFDAQDFEVLDKNQNKQLSGIRKNDQRAGFENYNMQLLYKKTYPKAGKELTADANVNFGGGQNGYLFSTWADLANGSGSIPAEFQKNDGKSSSYQGVFQLDYVDPLSETSKLEMGVKSYYKNSISSNTAMRSVNTQDFYLPDTNMSNRYVIDDLINAAYINYNNQTRFNINYQAGLRFEQSYYKGTITDKQQSFSYNYPAAGSDLLKSIFPGIYLSKKFNKNQEWQLNFSRKIQRPNFFQLMPFVMFADRQNYRIGNPQLKPEFKNISEINYNKVLTSGSYLGSGYFRYEEQPITDVAYPSLEDPTVLVNTSVNGRNAIRYGMEHTYKYSFSQFGSKYLLLKWIKNLDLTLNLNAFYIYIKGTVVPTEPEVKAEGFAFNSKAILSYRLPKAWTLQINGNYESPRILLLGYSLPIYSMDISVNKMIASKWIINASLSDVFNTRRMGTHYETPYYLQDLSRRRESRYVRLSVSYIFGKMDASIFKKAKQMRQSDGNQGNQDGLDFGR